MNVREALEKLCDFEMDIHVDFDEDQLPSFQIERSSEGRGNAWPFFPPGGNTTLEVPAIFHTYRLRSTKLAFGSRFREYEIGIQIFVAESGVDAYLQQLRAHGVDEAFQNAFAARVMLGDGETYVQNLRSENGVTLARLQWPPESDRGYVGLDYTVDLHLHDAPVIGPGE